jgi:hypothetical protein
MIETFSTFQEPEEAFHMFDDGMPTVSVQQPRNDCCDSCLKENDCATTYARCVKAHALPGKCSTCSPCEKYRGKGSTPFKSAADMIREKHHADRPKQQHLGGKGVRR